MEDVSHLFYSPNESDANLLAQENIDANYIVAINIFAFADHLERTYTELTTNAPVSRSFTSQFRTVQQISNSCLGFVFSMEGEGKEVSMESEDRHENIFDKICQISNPDEFFSKGQDPKFCDSLTNYLRKHLNVIEATRTLLGERCSKIQNNLSPESLESLALINFNLKAISLLTKALILYINPEK